VPTPRPVALLLAAALAAPAAARERSEIPEGYTWNLADLFASEADWVKAREAAAARIPGLSAHRGHLGDSPAALLSALDELFAVNLDLERLYVYASTRSDEDTREARPRELKDTARSLFVDFAAATSWIRPELLSLDAARVKGFLDAEPRLAPYRFYVEDVLRWKPHTLSAPEEAILAEAGNLTNAGQAAYGILKDADLPWPTVTLSTGEAVRLDTAAFGLHRASRVRADRDLVFQSFFGAVKGFERTMGTTLDAQVKAHLFKARARRFDSALEAALFDNGIPTGVYTRLVADVRRSLPTFHRYLQLRRRMLGLETLRYQDLYVPMVGSVDLSFQPDEARAITLEAFAPLGSEYVAALRKGYQSRWTDYLPSTGKRAGAYSTGVYGVHPYQLLNFNGTYTDLSTLAHESGHSMHTYLAHSAQPYPTSDYRTFVAEVASTLNENLLLHHMLRKAKDDATRLALLGNHLDGLRGTLFRQTQFAEFELAIHQLAEKGEPLSGERLSALYLDITRAYYGHAQGVCEVPDLIAIEWAYVPHFYYDFYVYQYATSLVASTSIAAGMRAEQGKRTAVRDGYLAMLKAGGSKYPVELLREAGVDMTTSAPFDAAIAEMNATMDEMERILGRQEKARARPR
jgi:oligoendopeptidase F